jgi:hypothetical protein
VPGALVALIDARDSVVAEGLSSATGTRVLKAPPGTYRVRARRIGFLPFISPPLVMPRPEGLAITVTSAAVMLDRIVVNATTRCDRRSPGSESLAVVWDEIDKALRSSELTARDLEGFGQARTYRREVDVDGRTVSSDAALVRVGSRRPFQAKDPAALAAEGYVIGDETNGWTYYAPDESVLLSEQFATTHCFRLVRDPGREAEIGVEFEPAPGRRVPDIAGVLWVDQYSSELREIQFRFVNAGVVSRFHAEGFTRFVKAPSGAWLVEEWQLKFPLLSLSKANTVSPEYILVGYLVNGGRILDAGQSNTDR